jgi:predicted nucleic acid-binding protein
VILVDSDVVIAHRRGEERARTWLLDARERTGPLAVSVISVTEVTGGMRSNERHEVWRLLGSMHVEGVNEVIARRAGELMRRYRRSHAHIGLADYLIAGTVEVLGFDLATLNVRHFPMVRGLRAPFRLPR